ncbi:hypothetical protein LJC42_04860 [Eubacteriales bacterium OttesenSCG-928-K08]|nr:hypothetical protein [Eubacteriales bacterium OttesenSCG-928-K08]
MAYREKLSTSKQLALGAMCTALTVLSLFAASILPAGRVPFLFFSCMIMCVMTGEDAYLMALVSFLASSLISLLMLPNKAFAGLYVVLLGHYGIFRSLIGSRINSQVIKTLLKLLYCNVCVAIGLVLAIYLLGAQLTMPDTIPVWIIVLVVEVIFILLDVLYNACEMIYQARIKRALFPRR